MHSNLVVHLLLLGLCASVSGCGDTLVLGTDLRTASSDAGGASDAAVSTGSVPGSSAVSSITIGEATATAPPNSSEHPEATEPEDEPDDDSEREDELHETP